MISEAYADLRGADLSGSRLYKGDFRGANLRNADLNEVDAREADFQRAKLHGASFHKANLRETNFRKARLRDADLGQADLSKAHLANTDLRDANFVGANLSHTYLAYARLRWANLREANLSEAYLLDSDLSGVRWHGLVIEKLPSGRTLLVPTPSGWVLHVGCTSGSVQDLRDIIAGDSWPSQSNKVERARRRPILTAVADMADAWIAAHPHIVPDLAERWLP